MKTVSYLGCNVLFEGNKLMVTIIVTFEECPYSTCDPKNIKIEIMQIIVSSHPPLCQWNLGSEARQNFGYGVFVTNTSQRQKKLWKCKRAQRECKGRKSLYILKYLPSTHPPNGRPQTCNSFQNTTQQEESEWHEHHLQACSKEC